MSRTLRWTVALAATTAMVLTTGPVPGPATAGSNHRAAAALIAAGSHDLYFSPNGDGRHERARFVFRLSTAATVAAIVRDRDSRTIRQSVLGRLDPGRHQWSWGGWAASGGPVADGRYTVTLRATSGPRVDKVKLLTNLLTHLPSGRLMLSRLHVYPNATAVEDRLQAVYIRYGFEQLTFENLDFFGPQRLLRTRLVIRGPSGTRVFDRSSRGYRPSFEWTARADDGTPLPPGSYPLRLTVRDPAGNRTTIRRVAEVSSAQLTPQVWTATTTAADTSTAPGPVDEPLCNGCEEVCGPVPSDRYAGGLSFRPCDFGYAAVGYYGATPPVVPAPVDSYRIIASGGPTTPGEPDVGNFAQLKGCCVLMGNMGPGDATVSTGWRPVALTRYPYVPEGIQPVTWGFWTSQDNSYDLASMTVEYRYYVPVP